MSEVHSCQVPLRINTSQGNLQADSSINYLELGLEMWINVEHLFICEAMGLVPSSAKKKKNQNIIIKPVSIFVNNLC